MQQKLPLVETTGSRNYLSQVVNGIFCTRPVVSMLDHTAEMTAHSKNKTLDAFIYFSRATPRGTDRGKSVNSQNLKLLYIFFFHQIYLSEER